MSRLSERIAACVKRENKLRAQIDAILDEVTGT